MSYLLRSVGHGRLKEQCKALHRRGESVLCECAVDCRLCRNGVMNSSPHRAHLLGYCAGLLAVEIDFSRLGAFSITETSSYFLLPIHRNIGRWCVSTCQEGRNLVCRLVSGFLSSPSFRITDG